ncbi:uncharacterized protein LOC144544998 [Carex rostrata]
MVPLNLSAHEGYQLAQIFGCKVTHLPITYLGLPLHYKKPSLFDWQTVIDKIESRIQGWKGKLLSYGGRVTLLNSVLSAIPIYWLSVFVMPAKIRMRIDQLRRRFLWFGGTTVRKKYCLVSWDTVCKSKSQGGLGILDLKRLNQALLAKWWVRFQDPHVVGTWKSIILVKYGPSGFSSTCSSFWKGILKGSSVVEIGFSRKLVDPDLLVIEAFSQGSLHLSFTRQLTGVLLTDWHTLSSFLHDCTPNPNLADSLLWRWSSQGTFTVHSYYLWLEYGGLDIFPLVEEVVSLEEDTIEVDTIEMDSIEDITPMLGSEIPIRRLS